MVAMALMIKNASMWSAGLEILDRRKIFFFSLKSLFLFVFYIFVFYFLEKQQSTFFEMFNFIFKEKELKKHHCLE